MAVEDELRLDFQGEDSTLSSTAAKVVQEINTLDSAINNLISKFNSFSTASSGAESNLSKFINATNGIENISEKVNKISESFNSMNPAIEKVSEVMNSFKGTGDVITDLERRVASNEAQLQNANQTLEEAKNKTDNLTNSNTQLAQTYNIIGTAVGVVYSALKKWTLQAAEATRTQIKFGAVFDKTNGEFEEAKAWVDNYSNALYLDNIQVENAVARFRVLTNTMGVNNEKSKEMSFNMTQLAYDLSAVSGNDVSQTINQITSALGGQTKALTEYGITIQNATLQEILNAHGIDRKVESLNAAQLAEVRYMQIMQSSAGIQGYYAKTLMSPSNALNIIKTQFNMLAREIGNVFIPVLMALVPIVMAVTRALRSLAQALAKFFGINIDFDNYSDGLSLMAGGIDGIGDSADGTSKKMKNMLRDFDNLHVVDFGDTSGSGGGSGVGGGIGGGNSLFDTQEYKGLSGILDELSDKFKILEKIILAVGAAILGWNLGKLIGNFLSLIGILDKAKLGIFALGTALATAGLALVFDANKDIQINGLNEFNIVQTIIGAIIAGAGGALIAASLGATPAVALTIGLTIGISLIAINLLTGIAKAFKDKYAEEIETIKKEEGWYDEGTGLGKKIEITLDIIGKITSLEIVEKLKEFLAGTNETVEETNAKFEKVQQTLYDLFNIVDLVKTEFQGFKDEAITPLKEEFENFFNDVTKSFQDFYSENQELVDAIVKIFKIVIVDAIVFLQTKVNYHIALFTGLIKGFVTFFSGIIQTLLKYISGLIDSALTIINGFITVFKGIIHGDFKMILEGGKQILEGFGNFVQNIFKGVLNVIITGLNSAISLINSFIRAANRISIPDWPIFGSFAGKNLNIPEIPQISLFAEGGFPKKGDLFIANEREPELIGSMGNRSVVANNAQITEGIARASYGAFKQALSEMGNNFGGDTLVYVGDTQITDVITKKKNIQDKRFGR